MKTAGSTTIVEVPMHKIVDPKDELRKHASEEGLVGLWRSVKHVGLLAPIIVRKTQGGKLELVLGSRRLKTHRRFSKKDVISAVVMTGVNDIEALVMALSENLQREDLTPFEEAWGIFKLVNDYKLGAEETARRIGRAPGFVRSRLQLMSLEPEVQRLVAQRKVGIAQINTLATLPQSEQVAYARRVSNRGFSKSELKTLVRKESPSKQLTKRRASPVETYDGERVSLRIDGFVEWLQSIEPHVSKMPGARLHNVQLSLKALKDVTNKLLVAIDKAM